jgi:NitT/TauT family transport system ATP-binding protein
LSHLLHLEDLYKSYGDKLVLENIDLSVSAGRCARSSGRAACGKSTLFRLVLGQEIADKGTALRRRPAGGSPGQTAASSTSGIRFIRT